MKTYNVCAAIIVILLSMVNWQVCIAEERDSASAGLTIDGEIGLSAMIALTEGHIKEVVGCFSVLAMTSEVKSLDWDKMKPLLAEMQKYDVPSTLWFARTDGSYYTVDKGAADQNLKDREYFPKVMAGDKVIGSLVISRSTDKKGMVIAVPIKIDGKVSGILGATIFLDEFSMIIKKEMKLPDNVIFYAINDQANTALSWLTDMIFEYPTKQGNPSLSKAIEEMLSKDAGLVEYTFDGKKRKVIFQKSSLTEWWFALGVVED